MVFLIVRHELFCRFVSNLGFRTISSILQVIKDQEVFLKCFYLMMNIQKHGFVSLIVARGIGSFTLSSSWSYLCCQEEAKSQRKWPIKKLRKSKKTNKYIYTEKCNHVLDYIWMQDKLKLLNCYSKIFGCIVSGQNIIYNRLSFK